MNNSPPSYISFSNDQHAENDEHSEVTWSGYDIEPRSNPDPENHQVVLIEMKLHMIKQQAKLDLLASKLSKCQVENEILQAENAQLVNELADATTSRNTHKDSPEDPATGSDTLETENTRLQVVANIMRRSFQTYIKENRSNLKDLQRENEALRQKQQQRPQPCSSFVLKKVSSSDNIMVKTSLNTSFHDAKKDQQEEEVERPKIIDGSQRTGSTWITGEEGSRDAIHDRLMMTTAATAVTRRSSMGMPTSKKSAVCNKSEELLVEFGERRVASRRTSALY